jgi:hypothetical protein
MSLVGESEEEDDEDPSCSVADRTVDLHDMEMVDTLQLDSNVNMGVPNDLEDVKDQVLLFVKKFEMPPLKERFEDLGRD